MASKFGRYELLERISVGGMAEVFKGRVSGAAGFEKIVAIKRILPHLSDDQEFINMFVDEAKLSANLNHSNIGQVFEFGKTDNRYFIAMEYIHGKDCRRIQDYFRSFSKSMPVPMAIRIVLEVCTALEYAHGRRDDSGRPLGIVHRDISPQNILISYEGAVKLIDFGIAKALSRSSKTSTGNLKGKYGYMSPEQVEGADLDGRSDIFAAGTVLYELVSGQRLFESDSELGTLELVRKADVPPPSRANPAVPKGLDAIILKALTRRVGDRFQRAEEMHEALERFAQTTRMVFSGKQLSRWMKTTFAGEANRDDQPGTALPAPASLGQRSGGEAPAAAKQGPSAGPNITVRGRPAARPEPGGRPSAQPRPAPASRPAPARGASVARPGAAVPAPAGVPGQPPARPTMWGVGAVNPALAPAAPGRARVATPGGPVRPDQQVTLPPTSSEPPHLIGFGTEEDLLDQEQTRVSPETAQLASLYPHDQSASLPATAPLGRPSPSPGPARELAVALHGRADEAGGKAPADPLRKTIPDPNVSRPARARRPSPARVPPSARSGFTPEPVLGSASEAEVNDTSDTQLQDEFDTQKHVRSSTPGRAPGRPADSPRRPVEVMIPTGDGGHVDSGAPTLVPGSLNVADLSATNPDMPAAPDERPAPAPATLGGGPIGEDLDDGPTMIDPGHSAKLAEARRLGGDVNWDVTVPSTQPAHGDAFDEEATRAMAPASAPRQSGAYTPGRPGSGLSSKPPYGGVGYGGVAAGYASASGKSPSQTVPVPYGGQPNEALGFETGAFIDDGPTRAKLTSDVTGPERDQEQDASDPLLKTAPDNPLLADTAAQTAAQTAPPPGATIHWKLLIIASGSLIAAMALGAFLQYWRTRPPTVDTGSSRGEASAGSAATAAKKPSVQPGTAALPPRVMPKKIAPEKAEAKKAEVKKAEVKKEEPKKAEAKKVEPEKEEPKKAEPKEVEPEKEEPKEAEATKTEPKKTSKKAELASKADVEPKPKKIAKKAPPKFEPEPKKAEPKKKFEPKKRVVVEQPKKKSEPKKKAEGKIDGKKMGFLAVSSRPWARVYVDGKDTGRNTPIPPNTALSLKAGPHKVVLELPSKQRFTFNVTVKAGETAKLVEILQATP